MLPLITGMNADLASVKAMLNQQASWNDDFRADFNFFMGAIEESLYASRGFLACLCQDVSVLSENMAENFGYVLTALETINDNAENLPLILTKLTEMNTAQTAYFSAFNSFATDFSLKMDTFEAIFLRMETLLEEIKDSVLFAGERLWEILAEILAQDVSIETFLQALITIQNDTNDLFAGLTPILNSIQAAIEGLTITLEGDIDFPDYTTMLQVLKDDLAFIKVFASFMTDSLSSIEDALTIFFASYESNQTQLTTHLQNLKTDVARISSTAMQIRTSSQLTSTSLEALKDAFEDYVTADEEHKQKIEDLIETEERVSPGELNSDVYEDYEEEINENDEINEDAFDAAPELENITGDIEEEVGEVVEALEGFEVSVSELVTDTMDQVKFEVGEFSSSFRYTMDFPLATGGTYEAVFEVDFKDEPYSSIGNSARAIGIFVWTVITAVYAYRSSRFHLLAIVSS